ncbi:MAG: RNA pseudouridine synthase [Verrucomicrobia bacterium]|nr:RNA pseudouridine synthase [Verrucomicrobiota bacterium]
MTESFWGALPLGRGVAVLHRDANGVAALAKPAGVLSHPNTTEDEPRSLLTARYAVDGEFFEWPDASGALHRLWLLNRLDSATSGVILAAADGALAAEIRAQFKRKQVRKIYHALVFGAPRAPLEMWRDLLAVEKRGGQIRTAAKTGGGALRPDRPRDLSGHKAPPTMVPAESRMTVVRVKRTEPRLALIKLEPRTGRSHQLRVQCAKRGLPIVGDQTYGDFRANREFAKGAETKRLFLHSVETSFDYEWGGRSHRFAAKAPLPDEFEKFL